MLQKIFYLLLACLPNLLLAQTGYYKIENTYNERNWLEKREYYNGNSSSAVIIMTEEWTFDNVGNITHYKRTTVAPDLDIISLSTSTTSILTGNIIPVDITYKNIGAAATSTNCMLGLWLSQQPNTFPGPALASVPLGTIGIGSTSTQTINLTIPNGLSGSWQLVAKIDYNSNVMESNEINNSSSIPITINTCSGLAANPTIVPDLCGSQSGSVSVAPSGGQTPYTYSWSQAGQTGATINNLGAGFYTAWITDNLGCVKVVGMQVAGISTPFTVNSPTAQPSICGIATGNITYSGGTPPYTVQWSGTNYSANTAMVNNLQNQQSYLVTVKDVNNCIDTKPLTVGGNPPLTLSVNSVTSGSCAVKAIATGGVGSYTYSWSGGLGFGDQKTLVSGNSYTVMVVDQNACSLVYNTGPFPCTAPPGALGIDANISQGIYVYPNPGEGLYNVVSESAKISELQILDMQGKEVRNFPFSLLPTEVKTVDIRALSEGTYTFSFKLLDGSLLQMRVVKSH